MWSSKGGILLYNNYANTNIIKKTDYLDFFYTFFKIMPPKETNNKDVFNFYIDLC